MAAGAIDALRATPTTSRSAGSTMRRSRPEVSPRLTTMRQPFDRIAREMVHLLLDVIDGRPAARLTLPTEVVRRPSA